MTGIEWFVIGGIIVAAADQVIERTPYKENNLIQLVLTAMKAIFRVKD
ncbi:MAG: Synechococcus phage [Pseudomonadota bacterium]